MLGVGTLSLRRDNILLKAAGEGGAATAVDLVALEAIQLLDKSDSGSAHRKRGGCKAICLEDVGADHRQADDLLAEWAERLGAQGIVDMTTAYIIAGSGDPTIADCNDLHDLVHIERVADANSPLDAVGVFARRLHVPSGVHVEILKS